jgi:cell division GTPase FtsZ
MRLDSEIPARTETQPKILILGVGDDGRAVMEHVMEKRAERAAFIAIENRGALPSQNLPEADTVIVAANGDFQADLELASCLAETAKTMAKLTVGIVIKPLLTESEAYPEPPQADAENLNSNVDALLTVAGGERAREYAEQIILGLIDMLNPLCSDIEIDVQDVKMVVKNLGCVAAGIGLAKEVQKAADAALERIAVPDGTKARGLLLHITTDEDSPLFPLTETVAAISKALLREDGACVWGHAVDDKIGGAAQVLILAAGFVE